VYPEFTLQGPTISSSRKKARNQEEARLKNAVERHNEQVEQLVRSRSREQDQEPEQGHPRPRSPVQEVLPFKLQKPTEFIKLPDSFGASTSLQAEEEPFQSLSPASVFPPPFVPVSLDPPVMNQVGTGPLDVLLRDIRDNPLRHQDKEGASTEYHLDLLTLSLEALILAGDGKSDGPWAPGTGFFPVVVDVLRAEKLKARRAQIAGWGAVEDKLMITTLKAEGFESSDAEELVEIRRKKKNAAKAAKGKKKGFGGGNAPKPGKKKKGKGNKDNKSAPMQD
jgi:hypothetical protein